MELSAISAGHRRFVSSSGVREFGHCLSGFCPPGTVRLFVSGTRSKGTVVQYLAAAELFPDRTFRSVFFQMILMFLGVVVEDRVPFVRWLP